MIFILCLGLSFICLLAAVINISAGNAPLAILNLGGAVIWAFLIAPKFKPPKWVNKLKDWVKSQKA